MYLAWYLADSGCIKGGLNTWFFKRIKQKYAFKGRQQPHKEMVDIINDINCLLSLFFPPTENISGLKRVAFPRSDIEAVFQQDRTCICHEYTRASDNLLVVKVFQLISILRHLRAASQPFQCLPKLQENQELLDKRDLKQLESLLRI